MPATASSGARPKEAAESPSTSASASAASCMGTRPEELTARLAASASAPGAGCGVSGAGIGAGGEAAEHERWANKLLYLRLGAVPAVVAALAEPGASPAALVQVAAAAGSFACGSFRCPRSGRAPGGELDAPQPWPAARAPGVRAGPRDVPDEAARGHGMGGGGDQPAAEEPSWRRRGESRREVASRVEASVFFPIDRDGCGGEKKQRQRVTGDAHLAGAAPSLEF
ncbi:unnamed protein product [Urochloa humidicola]